MAFRTVTYINGNHNNKFERYVNAVPSNKSTKRKKFGISHTTRNNEHLQIWLKTRALLSTDFNYNPDDTKNSTNKYDQKLLQSNQDIIVQSFGGFNDILNVLIQTGNKEQLIKIYDVLKQIRLNNPLKSSKHMDEIDISDETDSKCNIQQLSNEEICCILQFLEKDEICKIKSTSKQFGISGLCIMNKKTIGVYNMNKVMNHQYKDVFKLNTHKLMSYHRYLSTINHSMMFSLWSRCYNIPIARQLICHCQNDRFPIFTTRSQSDYSSISLSKLLTINRLRPSYLLFDTMNVVVLTTANAVHMFEYNQHISFPINNTNYKMLILKYFDVFNQRIDIVNFILIHKDVTFHRLFDYIQNKFMINNQNQEWYTNFKQRLHQLKVFGSASHSFVIHKESDRFQRDNTQPLPSFNETSMHTICSNMQSSQIFVFQFQCNNEYIKHHAKLQEHHTLNKIYTQSHRFIKDFRKINILFDDFNDASFDHVISYLPQQQNSVIPDVSQSFSFQLSVGNSWNFGLLRRKIVAQLKNYTINCRNIELFGTKHIDKKSFRIISDHEIVANYYSNRTFKWKLVAYDTSITSSNECVYRVTIYVSHPSANAIKYKAKPLSFPIFLRYNKSFKVKDLCRYLISQINDIYSKNDEFESILSSLSSNNNVLSVSSCVYTMNETFTNNQTNETICEMDVYVMQHDGINKVDDNMNKQILRIRFVDPKKRFANGVAYSDGITALCGIPYLIGFKTNDDLQSIINGSVFSHWLRTNINCCYRFSAVTRYNQRTVATVSRKAGSYEHINIAHEVMEYSHNECLVIKLKKELDEF